MVYSLYSHGPSQSKKFPTLHPAKPGIQLTSTEKQKTAPNAMISTSFVTMLHPVLLPMHFYPPEWFFYRALRGTRAVSQPSPTRLQPLASLEGNRSRRFLRCGPRRMGVACPLEGTGAGEPRHSPRVHSRAGPKGQERISYIFMLYIHRWSHGQAVERIPNTMCLAFAKILAKCNRHDVGDTQLSKLLKGHQETLQESMRFTRQNEME